VVRCINVAYEIGDVRMMVRRQIFVGLVLAFIFLATMPVTSAFKVEGASLKLEVEPGEHISHLVDISITESEPANDFVVRMGGFGQNMMGGGEPVAEEEDSSPYTASPFLTISTTGFHLEPGSSQKILIEGDVPEDVGSGGKYAYAEIRSVPGNSGGERIGIGVGAGIPIILTVSGTELVMEPSFRTNGLISKHFPYNL
jgi:hypothetical protein